MPPDPQHDQIVEAVTLARESALRAQHSLEAASRAAQDARDARDAASRVTGLEVRLTSLEARTKPSGVWELARQIVNRLPPSHLALVVAVVAVAVVMIASSAPSLLLTWLSGVPQ
jgi:hypothetical protein